MLGDGMLGARGSWLLVKRVGVRPEGSGVSNATRLCMACMENWEVFWPEGVKNDIRRGETDRG